MLRAKSNLKKHAVELSVSTSRSGCSSQEGGSQLTHHLYWFILPKLEWETTSGRMLYNIHTRYSSYSLNHFPCKNPSQRMLAEAKHIMSATLNILHGPARLKAHRNDNLTSPRELKFPQTGNCTSPAPAPEWARSTPRSQVALATVVGGVFGALAGARWKCPGHPKLKPAPNSKGWNWINSYVYIYMCIYIIYILY